MATIRRDPVRLNARKIGDWVNVNTEFDRILKTYQKAQISFPAFYLKSIASIEDSIKLAATDKKKMNALNAKALNAMKQKIKKYCKEI